MLTTHLAVRVFKAFGVIVDPPLGDLYGRLRDFRELGEAENETGEVDSGRQAGT
jgi:hypothetical protein